MIVQEPLSIFNAISFFSSLNFFSFTKTDTLAYYF